MNIKRITNTILATLLLAPLCTFCARSGGGGGGHASGGGYISSGHTNVGSRSSSGHAVSAGTHSAVQSNRSNATVRSSGHAVTSGQRGRNYNHGGRGDNRNRRNRVYINRPGYGLGWWWFDGSDYYDSDYDDYDDNWY